MNLSQFKVSEKAAKKIESLLEPNQFMRVEVLSGGCNGLQYRFKLDNSLDETDLLFVQNNCRVAVDQVSLEFLNGAELDWKDNLIGSYFAIQNPQAKSSCGCGTSFSVD